MTENNKIVIDLDSEKLDHLLKNKLNNLLKEKKINRSQLSRESGIPYSTIDGFFQKGMSNMRLSTLLKLSKFFDVPLSYFFEEDKNNYSMKKSDTNILLERMQVMENQLNENLRLKPIIENLQKSFDLLNNIQSPAISVIKKISSQMPSSFSSFQENEDESKEEESKE